jgi:hypothetical protein
VKSFLLNPLIVLVCAASALPIQAQGVPSGCAVNLISIATVSGSSSYVRLRYEIEALWSAQQGVASMSQGLKEFKAASEASTGLSAIITGTNDANDALHCSAIVMEKYTAANDDDRVIRGLMIQAFDQEATAVIDLQGDIKRKILIAVGQSDQKTDVAKDAEVMSAMQAKQKYAAESLLMAVEESLMLAVDLSNMKAKNTAKTTLSCSEFKDLRKKSSAITNGEKSTYRDDASLFIVFLNSHECMTR